MTHLSAAAHAAEAQALPEAPKPEDRSVFINDNHK